MKNETFNDIHLSEFKGYMEDITKELKANPSMDKISEYVEAKQFCMDMYDAYEKLKPEAVKELTEKDFNKLDTAKAFMSLTYNLDGEVLAVIHKEGAVSINDINSQKRDEIIAIRQKIGAFTYPEYKECFPMEDITVKELKEKLEAVKDMEIVESNDGYVMNRSEVTPENEAKLSEKVEKGNEVTHSEAPRETTSDASRVSPNVKYETAHNKGTKESKENKDNKENER